MTTATRSVEYCDKMSDSVLGSGSPANVVCRLWLVAPSLNGSGGSEVAGNSYVAPVLVNNPTNFPAASAGLKASATAFVFPTATGVGWGAVVASSVHDALTNDLIDLVVYADVPLPPVVVGGGDTVHVNAGDYTITIA